MVGSYNERLSRTCHMEFELIFKRTNGHRTNVITHLNITTVNLAELFLSEFQA